MFKMEEISWNDFEKVDIRVGKILEAEDFPEAKNPSYKLKIDFGKNIGIKKSSAQLVKNYTKEDLKGMKILAVVNFPKKQIGPMVSEVLVLGVPRNDLKDVILVKPDKDIPLGGKLY